jgi:hypothetical protein
MSQAGRDECQIFPVATLNNNDRRSKVAMANPRLLQTYPMDNAPPQRS